MREFLKKEALLYHSMEAHAMQAKKGNCEFIALATGLRGGKDYEKDTYRLSKKNQLIKSLNKN